MIDKFLVVALKYDIPTLDRVSSYLDALSDLGYLDSNSRVSGFIAAIDMDLAKLFGKVSRVPAVVSSLESPYFISRYKVLSPEVVSRIIPKFREKSPNILECKIYEE